VLLEGCPEYERLVRILRRRPDVKVLRIGLNCDLVVQRVRRGWLLMDDYGLLPNTIPEIDLLESEEVSLVIIEQVLRLLDLYPKLLKDRWA
jgi:hypothetical protein